MSSPSDPSTDLIKPPLSPSSPPPSESPPPKSPSHFTLHHTPTTTYFHQFIFLFLLPFTEFFTSFGMLTLLYWLSSEADWTDHDGLEMGEDDKFFFNFIFGTSAVFFPLFEVLLIGLTIYINKSSYKRITSKPYTESDLKWLSNRNYVEWVNHAFIIPPTLILSIISILILTSKILPSKGRQIVFITFFVVQLSATLFRYYGGKWKGDGREFRNSEVRMRIAMMGNVFFMSLGNKCMVD